MPLPARMPALAVTRRHFFYIHGFASSARSSKARFLAERLASRGLTLRCPDFNEPDFSTLTITRMIDQLEAQMQALPPAPAVLIGSSLGGLVALQAAARLRPGTTTPVERLILLAPALEFRWHRLRELGPEGIATWRATGRLDVFHYGYGEIRPLSFAFYEDALRYDALAAALEVPILIFQGSRDESVDPATVERFARTRPNVTLRMLDDDHQLLASLDVIWRETAGALEIPTPADDPASSSSPSA